MRIECSIGDVIDRLTILAIKAEVLDPSDPQLQYVERERQALLLAMAVEGKMPASEDAVELRLINRRLWRILDEQRRLDEVGEFGPEFVELSRDVYRLNDRRAAVKAKIDVASGSEIREVKLYGRAQHDERRSRYRALP